MKYMLLICDDESAGNEIPDGAMETWLEEMQRRGIRKEGYPLRPTSDATTVRVRNGAVQTLDGPFAETKEQLAGYDVIECADLDEALEVASKHPVAAVGAIEVRPFWED